MSIRYCAYPVDARQIEFAQQAPRAFLNQHPPLNAWGLAEDESEMLSREQVLAELPGALL